MINGILKNFEISCWVTCIWLKFTRKFFLYQNKISPVHPSSFANFSNSHYKSQYQEKFQYIPVHPVHSSAAGHPDKVYHSQLWKDHPKPLLVAETSFNMPVSNAKFDHLFSSMKYMKIENRTSLRNSILNNIVKVPLSKISIPTMQYAIEVWANKCIRETNQKENLQQT